MCSVDLLFLTKYTVRLHLCSFIALYQMIARFMINVGNKHDKLIQSQKPWIKIKNYSDHPWVVPKPLVKCPLNHGRWWQSLRLWILIFHKKSLDPAYPHSKCHRSSGLNSKCTINDGIYVVSGWNGFRGLKRSCRWIWKERSKGEIYFKPLRL